MRVLLIALMVSLVALAGCSDNDPDADDDNDGLTQSQEQQGWTIIIDFVGHRTSRHVDSDPTKQDTDGDGVIDAFEFALGLDPRSRDTDEDGLSDCQEVMHTVRSECEDTEWEGQTDGGYKTLGNNADSDGYPSRYIRDVLGYTDDSGTLPEEVTWGDGISDGEELAGYNITIRGGTRFVTTDPFRVDSDGDTLEDGEERFLFGSDPTVIDTDGDGCMDGLDPIPDQVERFGIGMESITWAPAGRSGSQDVQLVLHIADNSFNYPAGGGMTLQHGVATDLSGADLPVGPAAQCSYPPWHPWVLISVQAREVNSGEIGDGLDMSGHDVPNDIGGVWWNLRDGRFHFDAERKTTTDFALAFTAEDGRLTWSGQDGSVTLRPAIFKDDNQNA